MDKDILEIKEYARINNVPIMMDDGIEFLLEYIKKNNILNILEIGTAIGYSSIMMARVNKNIKITTIERDINRYREAIKNINKLKLNDQITVILDDAFNVDVNSTFDLIFIDAAKAQNIGFFEKFTPNLKVSGAVITDNLNFHGMVDVSEKDIKSRNVRGLVRKIKKYIEYLKNNSKFDTTFYSIGDGISISIKKES